VSDNCSKVSEPIADTAEEQWRNQLDYERKLALEQLSATADVLEVINRSPQNLGVIFDAMLSNALRLCHAEFGILFTYYEGLYTATAMQGTSPEFTAWLKKGPINPHPSSGLGRIMHSPAVVHVRDVRDEDLYKSGDPLRLATADLGGARTFLAVPMVNGEELIGAFTIYRQEIMPFEETQIALVKAFSRLAVIAIENARLLNEVRTLNQQLETRVADQLEQLERLGRLRRFLPPQIADVITSSGTEHVLESHRRQITAVFCDLRGFTGFSETAEPEDVMSVLKEYHEAVGSLIFKHGGTLERFVGDGLMVIFNDPVPCEDPALRAIKTAIEMRDAVANLATKWRRLGHEIGFGVGIAHGYATLGTIGFEGRFDYAAIGTVANTASRLCDEAKNGQILISPRVFMAIEGVIRTEEIGELSLKGLHRPMLVHNLVGLKSDVRSS
jgi:class 3 adenylate cyclase